MRDALEGDRFGHARHSVCAGRSQEHAHCGVPCEHPTPRWRHVISKGAAARVTQRAALQRAGGAPPLHALRCHCVLHVPQVAHGVAASEEQSAPREPGAL